MSKVRPIPAGPCIRHCPKLVSVVSVVPGATAVRPALSFPPLRGSLEGGTHRAQHKCCNQALHGSMSGREGGTHFVS